MRHKIGVIGGAGVAATNLLCTLVENQYTLNGATRDADHPEMIVWQATQVPSRSMYYEKKGPSFIEDYIDIGNKLISLGSTILCMCCNTAHAAFNKISSNLNIPLINLIDQIVIKAKNCDSRNFILLASDGCLASQIYQNTFKRIHPKANLILPDKETQELVTKGICNIKNKNRFLDANDKNSPYNIFSSLTEKLHNLGTIIIGCTDIRVAYAIDEDLGIDSLEVLAESIIEKCSS